MSIETYLIYLGVLAAFFLTPPDTSQLLIISNSLRHGLRRSLATVAGDLSANAVQMTLAAFGLTAVIAAHAPDAAAVEQTFVNKDAAGTLKLGQARGIALLAPAQAGLPVAEYAPNAVKKAIAAISDDAWATIEYTDAVFDEASQRWVSRAEVAEIPFTAFAAQKKTDQVPGRLVVRRIPDFNAEKNKAAGQYTLFGEVVSGMDAVRKIKKGSSANNGAVSGPDKIIRMRLLADAK